MQRVDLAGSTRVASVEDVAVLMDHQAGDNVAEVPPPTLKHSTVS